MYALSSEGSVHEAKKGVPDLKSLFLGRNTLHWAIEKNDTDLLRKLLSNGGNTNEKRFGKIPLMLAAENANVAAVKLLVDMTKDLQCADRQGNTALMLAAGGWGYRGSDREERCLEIVKMLLEKGAYPKACGKRGQTAMRYALGAGHRRIMALLEEYCVPNE